jgi:chemotaxis protein CheX
MITQSTSTGNIVKNTLQQANIPNLECIIDSTGAEITDKLSDDSFILFDWEGPDPDILSAQVNTLHKACEDKSIPILLLSTKQNANTTFSGMKAGACGVVNKPFEAEELIKALGAARKAQKTQKKPSINVEFINPFIESTRNVLKTMAGIDVERKKLFLKDDHTMMGDVSGVMGLSGDASGSVVISLPAKLAITIVSKMLGEEPSDTLTPEICDGVGELINMISGQAKASLTKTKYHFQISIPTVVQGVDHEISHKKGTPNIVVLFTTGTEEFVIQVCLTPKD